MTLYGRSDIETIAISGVGHTHVRTAGETNMVITCAECEPALLKMGWSTDPRTVELTYDEILDAELAQQDIARFEQIKVAESARAAVDAVRTAGKTTARKPARRGPTR
jgi:hypothetical protein